MEVSTSIWIDRTKVIADGVTLTAEEFGKLKKLPKRICINEFVYSELIEENAVKGRKLTNMDVLRKILNR